MSRQQCFTVFKFEELSDAAKEKARSWYRDSDTDPDNDFVIDDFVERAKECGWDVSTHDVRLMNGKTYPKPSVWYSGFWSQGDGACFEGRWHASDVNPAKMRMNIGNDEELLRIVDGLAAIAKDYPEMSASVKHQGHYYHRFETEFVITEPEDDDDCVRPHETEKDFIDLTRDLMLWLYKRMEEVYDYSQSDECVDENITANEYEFTEAGKRSVVL